MNPVHLRDVFRWVESIEIAKILVDKDFHAAQKYLRKNSNPFIKEAVRAKEVKRQMSNLFD